MNFQLATKLHYLRQVSISVIALFAVSAPTWATRLPFVIQNCGDGQNVPQDYGDNVANTIDGLFHYERGNGFTPDLQVDYATWEGQVGVGAPATESLSCWSNGFGDLNNVAYPSTANGTGEVVIFPDSDRWSVRLNNVDLAAWAGHLDQPVTLRDDNYNILQEFPHSLGGGHSRWEIDQTFNGPVRIAFGRNWNISIDNLNFDQELRGDFDSNNIVDVHDVNFLSFAIQGDYFSHEFDLNRDLVVDSRDLTSLIKRTLSTWIGDANLDGEFNSSDLVGVFRFDLYEQDVTAQWTHGDWNADGRFDSADLVAAFQCGGYELGSNNGNVAVVPEPGYSLPVIIAALCTFSRSRRYLYQTAP